MEQAAFKLSDYTFPATLIDFGHFTEGDIDISFNVDGKYKSTDNKFFLSFGILATIETVSEPFIKVDCEGIFEFINVSQFSEIPDFFYTNCIAILFPYLRSYISTVTVQSNIKPIILPTLNLTPLAKKLRESSKEI